MPSWLPRLSEIFHDSNGHWNWPWVGATILAAGAAIAAIASGAWAVFKFFAERKKANEKKGGNRNVKVDQGFGAGHDQTFQGAVTFAPSPELVEQIQRPLAEQLAAQNVLITNLTKSLLEKNPSAGPGAQQAVGEAVQSIAKGAAEGDRRQQQALDLLKANKIAEAAQLLYAFAEDKTARIETDRKEAAIAYRNLGTIASLRDPKRALEAYERALVLDPDDIKSLFWAGWIPFDYYDDLDKAQTRLERVLKLAETRDRGYYECLMLACWALTGLGLIKQRRGDSGGALQSYSDILPIRRRLAELDPDNALWQRELSVSLAMVGIAQMAQGDLAGALKSFQDGFVVFERLAKSDPGNAFWQHDLSVSLNNIGDVQKAQGELNGALKSYSDGLAIIERLAKSNAGNVGWQRDLSLSYEKVGDVQLAHGDLAGALKSYSDSLAVRERLAKYDPDNAVWQCDLAASYERVGDVQMAQGDLAGALKSRKDGLAIADRLAKSDPDNAERQRELAVSFGKLALVYRQSGDKKKAREFLRQGREIMARLTKLSPETATWRQDLARFDGQIAVLAKR